MEILARAVGRRKEAVAQVQLVRGNGQFLINDKPAQTYLQNNSCSLICIKSPLEAALSLYSNNLSNTKPEGTLISATLDKQEEQNPLKTVSTEQSESLSYAHPEGVRPAGSTGEANLTNGSGNEGQTLLNLSTSASSTQPESLFLESDGLNDSKQLVFTPPTSPGGVNPSVLSLDEIDVIIKVKGGGLIGQAEAIKLGIARAFCFMQVSLADGLLRKTFKTKGYLTQDSRIKERRKYGLKKARKASQYHKR